MTTTSSQSSPLRAHMLWISLLFGCGNSAKPMETASMMAVTPGGAVSMASGGNTARTNEGSVIVGGMSAAGSKAPAPSRSAGGGAGVAGLSVPTNSGAAGASGSVAPTVAMTGARPATTASGFMSLAPAPAEPLDEMGKAVTPPPPAGWTYHEIAGTACRDGSPAGFFLHRGTEPKLILYLEGGGACINAPLCGFNQTNVNESFAGDGSTLIGSALGVVQDRQQPGVFTSADHQGQPAGIFDLENPMNPVKGWSEIYIPYCSGDIHFGTRKDVSVKDLASPQQFVGYKNMTAFVSRIVPTFAGKLDQVAISGSSAGSIGALLNASMLQDAFGDVPVSIIADAGLPLRDMFWPTCLQSRFRESWGLNAALAPDCKGCFRDDGSGLTDGFAEYLWSKHPNMRVAAVARTEDEIMRNQSIDGAQRRTPARSWARA